MVLTVTTAWTAAWMAPDAFLTAVLIGLAAAAVAMVVHVCGHLVVAGRLGAKVRPSGWTPGLALAVVGMPFYVPAGPFLAERIETGDPRRDWWVSFAGIAANLAAAGIALLIYLAEPMPFLRILIATQLAVAAFALIPSNPLDGDRLSTQADRARADGAWRRGRLDGDRGRGDLAGRPRARFRPKGHHRSVPRDPRDLGS